jgi:hypothetical protein
MRRAAAGGDAAAAGGSGGRAASGRGAAGADPAHWQREGQALGRSAAAHRRPTISMQTYARLMVLKHRTGWL